MRSRASESACGRYFTEAGGKSYASCSRCWGSCACRARLCPNAGLCPEPGRGAKQASLTAGRRTGLSPFAHESLGRKAGGSAGWAATLRALLHELPWRRSAGRKEGARAALRGSAASATGRSLLVAYQRQLAGGHAVVVALARSTAMAISLVPENSRKRAPARPAASRDYACPLARSLAAE